MEIIVEFHAKLRNKIARLASRITLRRDVSGRVTIHGRIRAPLKATFFSEMDW